MSSDDTQKRSTFSDALSSLIDEHSESLSASEISEVLGEYSQVLASGSLAPDARVEGDREPFDLFLEYGSPVALERDLNNLLQIQGIVVELDRELPALSDLAIRVSIAGFESTVELAGRPVTRTPAGTALQIEDVPADVRARLESLPDRARQYASDADASGGAQVDTARGAARASNPPASRAPSGSPAPTSEPAPRSRGLARDEPFEAERWTPLRTDSVRDALIDTALRPGLWALDIQTSGARVQALITKGQLRDIRRFPRAESDRLEILLQKANKLDDEEVQAVQDHIEAHGGGASEALLERAIMGIAEISVAESTRLRFLLERVWSLQVKEVRVAELNRLPRRCLAPARHALEYAFHLLEDEALERDGLAADVRDRLGDKSFRISENPPFDLKLMSLSPKQKSTIDVLSRESLRLDAALRMSVLDEPKTLALLWTLDELELLDSETVRTWTRQQTRTIERISVMHAKLDRSTHFDILGVHWSAFDDEIEEAYEQLSERVSEEAINDELPEEIHTKAAEVRERLEEAYEVLSGTRSRKNYREKVVDQFKLRTSIQMFEKQADTAKLRRDIDGAIDFYRRILELDPSHGDAKRDLAMLEGVKRDKDKANK